MSDSNDFYLLVAQRNIFFDLLGGLLNSLAYANYPLTPDLQDFFRRWMEAVSLYNDEPDEEKGGRSYFNILGDYLDSRMQEDFKIYFNEHME